MQVAHKTIAEQLTDIALTHEAWYKGNHPYEESFEYHRRMFDAGNIIIYEQEGVVLGYFEVWFINFEQFGRIMCQDNWNQLLENISDGKLAYVANVWIHENFRKGLVYKILRNRFFEKCRHCDYYCGTALRKKTQPVKVFRVSNLVNKLYKGEQNG